MNILILGGYGTFGGRLATLLTDEARLTLIIAGRSFTKAESFCRALPAAATLKPLAFDRDADVKAQLEILKPQIVVDASGPFQFYGDAPYRVVEACIALGIDYLDLADGSDFVKNVAVYDAAAKERGVFILSGVSSFPVLTAAVVRELARGMPSVRSITGGIAPSPYAGVGLNVIRAIASYAGQPVALVRGGKKSIGYGLTEVKHYTICPPGRMPLRRIRFSLVDVPDLQVLPDAWPELESIWMGAGPVPEILHRALNALAWLVRLKLLRSLRPFAMLFHHAINILRWGEHRGGMFVSVSGMANGQEIERSWHLLAEGDHGPLIPSMAIEAIIRKLLDGSVPPRGARAASDDLALADYDALFAKRAIVTGFRDGAVAPGATLYQRLLGEAWDLLPEPIRAMHQWRESLRAQGEAVVERGTGVMSRLVGALMRFPRAGVQVPVEVTFHREGMAEVWQRNFAGKTFKSVQSQGGGRLERLLCERFGLLNFGIALVWAEDRLNLVVRHWSLLGVPLPVRFAPTGEAYEHAIDGIFHFHVEIRHPLTGLIVRYRGPLTIV